MMEGVIVAAVVVALIAGLWITRNAKGPGGPPGSAEKNALLDRQAEKLRQGEAFKNEKPKDY